MLCFIAFLGLLGIFAALGAEQVSQARDATEMLKAKVQSEGCALTVDAFYANSGGVTRGQGVNCYMNGQSKVTSMSGGFEKSSSILNSRTKLTHANHGTDIEVKINEHYR